MKGICRPGIEGSLPAGKVASIQRGPTPPYPHSVPVHRSSQEYPSHSGVEGSLPARVEARAWIARRLPQEPKRKTPARKGVERRIRPMLCLYRNHSGVEGYLLARVLLQSRRACLVPRWRRSQGSIRGPAVTMSGVYLQNRNYTHSGIEGSLPARVGCLNLQRAKPNHPGIEGSLPARVDDPSRYRRI